MPSERARLQESLRRLDDESWRLYLEELRRLDVGPAHPEAPDASEEYATAWGQFRRADPGTPLGPGYPSGPVLGDGTGGGHKKRWMQEVRRDPCAYCGERPAGTVDHIVPRSRAAVGVGENWLNFTAACEACNRLKSSEPLLPFLLGERRRDARLQARRERVLKRERDERLRYRSERPAA